MSVNDETISLAKIEAYFVEHMPEIDQRLQRYKQALAGSRELSEKEWNEEFNI